MAVIVSEHTATARPAAGSREATAARRTFQVVYTLLTVQFAVLGIGYLSDPARAVHTFSTWNQRLGGVAFAPPDVPPWRYATAIGMTTLALMCAMALLDLRRNHPVVVPAAFFKGYNAILWLYYADRHLPVFYAAAVIDALEVVVMVAVARWAYTAWARPSRSSR